MEQLFKHMRTGESMILTAATPQVGANEILVESVCSLISPGTERMLSEFANASLVKKAMQQPDRVREVLQKVRTDGLKSTLQAVFSKLDEPLALGYCNVGIVRAVGRGVSEFSVGDRVISNGPHAEMVCVLITQDTQILPAA